MLLALLIALIALVGAAALVGGSLYLAGKRSRQSLPSSSAPQLPAGGGGNLLERTIKDIRVGDVVQFESRDFLVEGVISYNEDGHTWNAARIIDGADERWVIIGHERGGGMTVRMMTIDPALEVSGYPPEQMTAGETRFTQDKRGTATASVTGEAGTLPIDGSGAETVLRCRWWRYETAGEESLIVEQWGQLYRVLRGRKIGNDDLELMPGS